MKLFKLLLQKRCNHKWEINKRANALQFDACGYPLRLFLLKCPKCGKYKHMWLDVSEKESEELKTRESFLVVWSDKDEQ